MKRLFIQLAKLIIPELIGFLAEWILVRKNSKFRKEVVPIIELGVYEAAQLAQLKGPEKMEWVLGRVNEYILRHLPLSIREVATTSNLRTWIEIAYGKYKRGQRKEAEAAIKASDKADRKAIKAGKKEL